LRASAIVGPGTIDTGPPCSRASCIADASSGSTPIIRTCGRSSFTAVAIPEISPPPPIGTITTSSSGTWSTSSSPTVPWPAITIASS
jgi:hypothetical protein